MMMTICDKFYQIAMYHFTCVMASCCERRSSSWLDFSIDKSVLRCSRDSFNIDFSLKTTKTDHRSGELTRVQEFIDKIYVSN